jgi:type II secretory pathway pseudopilin PulG
MIRALRARLRQDAGFTLTELMLGLAISMIVATAALTILNVTLKRVGEVEQRVDSTQRGRMLMDTLTRQLRSQICMTTDVPPIRQTTESTNGGYKQSISFYSDMTDGRTNAVPQLRTLSYDENRRTIVEEVRNGTGIPPAVTYAAAPITTRTIGTNVIREVVGGTPKPIFRYYGFTTGAPGVPATPTLSLPASMAIGSANVKMVSRIAVNYRMVSTRQRNLSRTSTVFANDVYVRAADPNDPAPIPTCA